jgi:hypothetical protein
VIILQQPAYSLLTLDDPMVRRNRYHSPGKQKLIAFALMIWFLVIMRDEILNGSSERCFAEQDQALQTRLLIERTNLSAYAFRFGDCGGNFIAFTPILARMH